MEFPNKILRHLHPSGLNSKFEFASLNFTAYITAVKNRLQQVNRIFHLQLNNKMIELNSPFEWQPKQPTKKAALLIHGLFDSPFIMRDVANHLVQQGYLVRSILLPGHATIPADLLATSSKEWIKAVAYGIKSFPNDIEALYLVGFSTGAILSLNYILKPYQEKIAGLIMFSPAFAVNTKKNILVHLYRMSRWLFKRHKWVFRTECPDYTKYTSFPINSAYLLQRLINENKQLLKTQICQIPVFIAMSANDETVRPERALDFFQRTFNPNNIFFLYSNQDRHYQDNRIHILKSRKIDENILDFSHPAVLIAPENHHYGRHGDHQELLHQPKSNVKNKAIYLGAISKENESRYRLRRLTYNPYFADLMKKLDTFMQHTVDYPHMTHTPQTIYNNFPAFAFITKIKSAVLVTWKAIDSKTKITIIMFPMAFSSINITIGWRQSALHVFLFLLGQRVTN